MIRRLTVLVLSSFCGAAAQTEPFRVETNVVQVPVVVTGKKGRSVESLTARDFRVMDDGVRQKITVDDFSTGLAPISLVIAIQTAGISSPALVRIRRIGGMIEPLVIGARGEAAVVAFDSRIKWLQDFTSDDDKLRDVFQNLKPGLAMDQARMLDAVAGAANHLHGRKGRKVLLLISESRDRGSETRLEQALEALASEGIEVFAAHYSAYATSFAARPGDLPAGSSAPEEVDPVDGPSSPSTIPILAMLMELARLGKTNAVQALTRETGGMDFPFTSERGMENAIQRLGVEVHGQYILSFSRLEHAVGMHKIDVLLPGHPDLLIRARRAYWADPENHHPDGNP